MPRIDPLPTNKWPPEMRDAMKAMTPPAQRYSLTSEGRPSGRNIFSTLAHNPRLATAVCTLNAHLLLATSLTERQRELVILRVAALRTSSYEWAQHIFMAHDAGLSDSEIAWIAWGPDAPLWNQAEANLLRAVDELVHDGRIADQTWTVLTETLNEEQILDVIFTAGAFSTVAWMLASLDVELDDDLRLAITSLARPTGAAT